MSERNFLVIMFHFVKLFRKYIIWALIVIIIHYSRKGIKLNQFIFINKNENNIIILIDGLLFIFCYKNLHKQSKNGFSGKDVY